MSLINLTNEDFKEIIKEDIVLVDFYADWCGPCKMLSPIIDKFANEVTNITVVKVNIDQNQDLAMEYGIMSIPTLILFRKSEKIGVKQGFQSKEMLMKWINENK